MIFFVGNDGTVIKSEPSPVYQGAANANNIYLVAPFASNLTVTVVFTLPNGVISERYTMTAVNEISGVINEQSGNVYSGWKFSLPNEITKYYGVVTAQFFFYSAQNGVISASSSTSFTVGRGVPNILPDEPSDNIYEAILSAIAGLQSDLNNGYYASRAIYAWNSEYTYGANEIVFYPNIGEYGAFIKSKIDNNSSQPYTTSGQITASWEEVVNFNEIHAALTEAVEQAQNATVQAEAARVSAVNATAQATSAQRSANQAEDLLNQTRSAGEQFVNQSTEILNQTTAQANAAANSAASAKTQAEIAAQLLEQFASYGVKINTDYTSFTQLPVPGNANNIYLIPNGDEGANSYDEWIWVDSKNAYEKIGNTEVDLTNLKVQTIEAAQFVSSPVYKTLDGSNVCKQNARTNYLDYGDFERDMALFGKDERPIYTTKALANNSEGFEEGEEITKEIAFLDDIPNEIPEITLNGTKTTTPSFYAPTAAGEQGQIPVWTGEENNPIEWMEAPSSGGKNNYATCSTDAGTAEKIVELEGFTLETGVSITVHFTQGNTANNPYLNINGTGAKAISADGDGTYVKWRLGAYLTLVYNGVNWVCVGGYRLAGKPVGTVETRYDSTSPATLYGGSWTGLPHQRYLRNITSGTAGATGGSSSHSHTVYGDAKIGISFDGIDFQYGTNPFTPQDAISFADGAGMNPNPMSNPVAIEGDTNNVNNAPPYVDVYSWRRTA